MASMQNTMRLAALLALQTLGGPPVTLSRKVNPIRNGIAVSPHWIAQARRYCDEQGRCVEQLAPHAGAVPPNMCRFYGYGDAVLQASDEADRDVEVQFPIAARTVEEAYKAFDKSLEQFIAGMQRQVEVEQAKAIEASGLKVTDQGV